VVASVPPPQAVTWFFQQTPVPVGQSRYKVVEEPVVGGVRSLLVISEARDSDFGIYNCSFSNAYGSDSAVILLQKQRALPLLIIIIIAVGAIVVIVAIILVVIMCQRHRQRGGDKPTAQVTADKLGHEAPEPNSSGSDLKVEIRTTSSGSGQVITDRWEAPDGQADWREATHDPALDPTPHRRLYDEAMEGNGFPPFSKEAGPAGGLYACYDSHGYVRPPLRALYTSSPSTPAEYGRHYAGYGTPPAGEHVLDSQLKPGTLATHV